jgi:chaperonin GroES
MDLKPLGDRIIVKPLEAEEVSKGGIVLPETAKEKPQEGKVVAVGAGKKNDKGDVTPLELKSGDVVLYGKYSGTEIATKTGEDFLIMREEDVFAVLK